MKDFEYQLPLTTKLEKEFCVIYNSKNEHNMEHIAGKNREDFIIHKEKLVRLTLHKEKTDIKVELKCDSHISDNIFIELIANERKNTIGGPYQSLANYGTQFYAVWFYNDTGKNLIVIDNIELCKWLDQNKQKYNKMRVENPNYYTIGILVRKETLLCQDWTKSYTYKRELE